MAKKQLLFGSDAAIHLRNGVKQLADAVRVTMGPTGRNVVLQKSFGSPAVTKDGVVIHEGKPMSPESLRSRLAEHFKNRSDQMVVIQADSTAHHGKVVEVMDIAQSAGFHRLAIATEEN